MTPTRLALTLAVLLAGTAYAQPHIDINLHRDGAGDVDVRLTPEADFSGVPSALVFTITWAAATPELIPELLQTTEQRALMALTPSGPVHEVGDKRYRIYSGIGLTPIAEVGQTWRGGMSFSIATFGPGAPDDLLIADDDWVKERKHNGAFYVSLNGLERTGHIIEKGTGGNRESGLTITAAPNPWNGGPLTVAVQGVQGRDVRMDLTDAQGKTIWSRTFDNTGAVLRATIRTGARVAAGICTLTATMKDAQETITLMVMDAGN